MAKTRTFIALPLPNELRLAIDSALAAPREHVSGVRWVEPGNLHLTLKFYGDVDDASIEAITARLAALKTAPFEISLEGLGAFPSWPRPRVVWVGLSPAGPLLTSLVESIEAFSSALGFPRETRPFRPHLTIGRVRQGSRPDLDALTPHKTQRFGVWHVTRLVLFASELSSAGARYRALCDRAL